MLDVYPILAVGKYDIYVFVIAAALVVALSLLHVAYFWGGILMMSIGFMLAPQGIKASATGGGESTGKATARSLFGSLKGSLPLFMIFFGFVIAVVDLWKNGPATVRVATTNAKALVYAGERAARNNEITVDQIGTNVEDALVAIRSQEVLASGLKLCQAQLTELEQRTTNGELKSAVADLKTLLADCDTMCNDEELSELSLNVWKIWFKHREKSSTDFADPDIREFRSEIDNASIAIARTQILRKRIRELAQDRGT